MTRESRVLRLEACGRQATQTSLKPQGPSLTIAMIIRALPWIVGGALWCAGWWALSIVYEALRRGIR